MGARSRLPSYQGSPFGRSKTISGSETSDGGASALTGYTIISAESLAAATDKAKGCPVLSSGGSIEIYEALEMG